MSETLLQMNHIRKHFGDLHVLEDISIEVHRGEVVSIIGPSGSGKSTLLRCATLLEKMGWGRSHLSWGSSSEGRERKMRVCVQGEIKADPEVLRTGFPEFQSVSTLYRIEEYYRRTCLCR